MCVLIELARVCHTIASTQLSYGNVEVHNHILHVTLASMKDQWGRIKDRIHAPNRSASSSHDAAPGDRTRSEVELYDSQLIPIFTLHRYHEAVFRSRYTSQHPWPQDMPTDFCPIGALV